MRYNNDKPRDDVERGRNVRNALANASVSDGMAFLPPCPSSPRRRTPPETGRGLQPPSAESTRLRHLLLLLFRPSRFDRSNRTGFSSLPLAIPPAITINQNRSQYLILVEWCSRGGQEGGKRESGDHRGGGIDGWELMQQCQ